MVERKATIIGPRAALVPLIQETIRKRFIQLRSIFKIVIIMCEFLKSKRLQITIQLNSVFGCDFRCRRVILLALVREPEAPRSLVQILLGQ